MPVCCSSSSDAECGLSLRARGNGTMTLRRELSAKLIKVPWVQPRTGEMGKNAMLTASLAGRHEGCIESTVV